MADFHFLRLEKVNVMRYLPKFLAGDMSFKEVQDTLSAEHERYRLFLPEITKQFFRDCNVGAALMGGGLPNQSTV